MDLPNGRSFMDSDAVESIECMISAVTCRAGGYAASKVEHRTIILDYEN